MNTSLSSLISVKILGWEKKICGFRDKFSCNTNLVFILALQPVVGTLICKVSLAASPTVLGLAMK